MNKTFNNKAKKLRKELPWSICGCVHDFILADLKALWLLLVPCLVVADGLSWSRLGYWAGLSPSFGQSFKLLPSWITQNHPTNLRGRFSVLNRIDAKSSAPRWQLCLIPLSAYICYLLKYSLSSLTFHNVCSKSKSF